MKVKGRQSTLKEWVCLSVTVVSFQSPGIWRVTILCHGFVHCSHPGISTMSWPKVDKHNLFFLLFLTYELKTVFPFLPESVSICDVWSFLVGLCKTWLSLSPCPWKTRQGQNSLKQFKCLLWIVIPRPSIDIQNSGRCGRYAFLWSTLPKLVVWHHRIQNWSLSKKVVERCCGYGLGSHSARWCAPHILKQNWQRRREPQLPFSLAPWVLRELDLVESKTFLNATQTSLLWMAWPSKTRNAPDVIFVLPAREVSVDHRLQKMTNYITTRILYVNGRSRMLRSNLHAPKAKCCWSIGKALKADSEADPRFIIKTRCWWKWIFGRRRNSFIPAWELFKAR